MAPAIGHDFPIFGKNRGELPQIFHWGAQRAWNVAASKGFSATRVEKHEVERSTLDGVQYVISLLFGAELMSEVVAVGSNFIGAKSHDCLPF